MTAAIVLAGGRSRRFGTDKLSAPMADGRSVLSHAVAAAGSVADELVVVVAPGAGRPEGLPDRAVIVHDTDAGAGPLLGLAAGLDAVTADTMVLVVGGDMPALEVSVLRLLIAALDGDPTVEAARLGVDGPATPGWAAGASVLPCVLRREAGQRACRDALAAGDRRLRGCLERLVATIVPAAEWRTLDPAGRTLLDIDRPGDLDGLARLDGRG